MSDSVRPHRQQPTRLPHPWDSPGKNTGVGCHFLLQCMKVKSESEVAQSCPTLCDPMDCRLSGSSVHDMSFLYGIVQDFIKIWQSLFNQCQNLFIKYILGTFYPFHRSYDFCIAKFYHSTFWQSSTHITQSQVSLQQYHFKRFYLTQLLIFSQFFL